MNILLCACAAFVLSCSALTSAAAVNEPSHPDARKGQHLFAQSCADCHDAHSTAYKVGPGLKGYYVIHHPRPTDAEVRALVTQGKGSMHGFSNLSRQQLDDLIAYLKTL